MTNPLPFDPDLPDPFNLKKKTVRLPDLSRFHDKDPMFLELATAHVELAENQNTVIDATQWSNRMIGHIWNRLADGEGILRELKIIRKIAIWAFITFVALASGAGAIVAADYFEHWQHFTK